MKVIYLLLLFSLMLYGKTYPSLFSQLGTPLYTAETKLQPLTEHTQFKKALLHYSSECKQTLQYGEMADITTDATQKKAYLKRLRKLQKEYDDLALFLKKQLNVTIKTDNYALFLFMVNSEAELFFENPVTNESIYSYYKTHRAKGPSAYLDKRIRKDERTVVQYNPGEQNFRSFSDKPKNNQARPIYSKVTVLSTPNCPYCKKAKQFLNTEGIAFKDYNINTSAEGKRLYKKYNGSGVPVVIIKDNVIHGFSVAKMKRALNL